MTIDPEADALNAFIISLTTRTAADQSKAMSILTMPGVRQAVLDAAKEYYARRRIVEVNKV